MSNIKVGEIVDHVALEAERELMSKLFGRHDTEEELVERLARAAANADGENNADLLVGNEPIWTAYATEAKIFLAMMKALQDG